MSHKDGLKIFDHDDMPWAGAMRKNLLAFSSNARRPLFIETGEVLSNDRIPDK